jgi:hypothetical protein
MIPKPTRAFPPASKRFTDREGQVFPMRIPRVLAFGGMITACLSSWAPAASAESRSAVEDKAVFAPIDSVHYDFGSKSMSGYFVQQGGACHVMLMVFETTDPDKSRPPSATRVRLVLLPGQIAGLDSEEGRSLNFTCGKGGATLLVDAGERDRLANLQRLRGTPAQ